MKQRRIDLDAMRIIACFLVIFNHLAGYKLYSVSDSALKCWIYMFPTMITRINVPLFFMISGTLLLTDRKESYRSILQRRCMRIICALALFTLILYLTNIAFHQASWSLSLYLRYLLAEPVEIGGKAYWYLYSYLGFLLLLPILRRIANGMTKADFILLLSVHFFFRSLMPVVNIMLSAHGIAGINISADFTSALKFAIAKMLFYPLIGYYIDQHIDLTRARAKQMAILCLNGLAGIIASSACTFYEGTHGQMTFTQNYVELFDYLTAICAFILIKYICLKHNGFSAHPRVVHAVTLVGGLTFGIYLMDPILKKLIYESFNTALEPHMPTILVSCLWCLASMAIGDAAAFGLKRIPGLKKIL